MNKETKQQLFVVIAVVAVIVLAVIVVVSMTGDNHTDTQCQELRSNYGAVILSYDDNSNNVIDRAEAVQAVQDYYADTITKAQSDAVSMAWQLQCDLSHWSALGCTNC